MKTHRRFKIGDLIKFGKFYGIVVAGNETGGGWLAMPVGKDYSGYQRPVRVMQNLAVEVIA